MGVSAWGRRVTPIPDAGNLSSRARRDLEAVLRESARTFGRAKAQDTRAEILERCRQIADGDGLGHVRDDLSTRRALRFWTVPPFAIVYDARTCLVIRILHGRRDIPRLLR